MVDMTDDAARDLLFAVALADELEAWLGTIQAPPHARRVLEAEVRRLRELRATETARRALVVGQRDGGP
jgi:hypothetical protein